MDVTTLERALVEAVLPLEVLAAQDRAKPYREMSRDFMASIDAAIATVRAALRREPPALDLETADAINPAGHPLDRERLDAELARRLHVAYFRTTGDCPGSHVAGHGSCQQLIRELAILDVRLAPDLSKASGT